MMSFDLKREGEDRLTGILVAVAAETVRLSMVV